MSAKKPATPPPCVILPDGSFQLRADLASVRFEHGDQRLLLRTVRRDEDTGALLSGRHNVTESLSEEQRGYFNNAKRAKA